MGLGPFTLFFPISFKKKGPICFFFAPTFYGPLELKTFFFYNLLIGGPQNFGGWGGGGDHFGCI